MEATFRYFDPWEPVRIYECNLPHWRQPGALYFVTFRLGDSLPQAAVEQMAFERRKWLRAHGLKTEDDLENLPASKRRQFFRHFNAKFHEWLDAGHGACWLRQPAIASVVAGALHHFDGQRCALGEYVVMPNHVHALVAPTPGRSIEDLLHSWKGFAGHEANGLLGRTGAFWQKESYDHIVRSPAQLGHYREYIASNPEWARLRAGEFVLGAGTLKDVQ